MGRPRQRLHPGLPLGLLPLRPHHRRLRPLRRTRLVLPQGPRPLHDPRHHHRHPKSPPLRPLPLRRISRSRNVRPHHPPHLPTPPRRPPHRSPARTPPNLVPKRPTQNRTRSVSEGPRRRRPTPNAPSCKLTPPPAYNSHATQTIPHNPPHLHA